MDTLHLNDSNVKMVAHRGLSGLETENTCAAFVAAGNRSYYGIETDIRRTADGKFILFHDNDTKRVGMDELVIEKTTFDTLRALRLCDKDGTKTRKDLGLATLEEYISICRKYDKVSVLEIKGAYKPAELEQVVNTIREMGWLEKTVFIAFDLTNMICLREMLPDQKLQFLIGSYPDWLLDTLKKYHLDLDIQYKALTAERVKELHDAGIEVNVWTVDSLEDAQRMVEYGVDYITSNIIE
ncbi:MAG: hypothetical protein E7329_02050 [Clostridiales bacterium]|nr:hypothetical protein [Clostridiales bacterium]